MGMSVAALWGFAEATLFFLVPDVWLSALALSDLRTALKACVSALVGALAGGVLMFAWGAWDPGSALSCLDRLPAIFPAMLERVDVEVRARGASALLTGPWGGIPYKIYAVQSGRRGVSLVGFLLWSVPGRLVRFVLVTLLAAGLCRLMPKAWTVSRRTLWHAAAWVTFYSVYFLRMPN